MARPAALAFSSKARTGSGRQMPHAADLAAVGLALAFNPGEQRRIESVALGAVTAFPGAHPLLQFGGWFLHAICSRLDRGRLGGELNAVLSPAQLPGGKPRGCPTVAAPGTTRGLHSPAVAGLAGRRQVRQRWRRPNFIGETPQQAAENVLVFIRRRRDRLSPCFVSRDSRRTARIGRFVAVRRLRIEGCFHPFHPVPTCLLNKSINHYISSRRNIVPRHLLLPG